MEESKKVISSLCTFDEMYDASEEEIQGELKQVSKDRMKRSWKRDFQQIYDQYGQEIDNSKQELDEMRMNLKEYKVQSVVEKELQIKDLEEQLIIVEKEYKRLFEEDIKNS
ncbi:MAG: hypothetical protein PVI88_00180 [Nitrosopumilaceae archaeon]|jgi:hypothetical protein